MALLPGRLVALFALALASPAVAAGLRRLRWAEEPAPKVPSEDHEKILNGKMETNGPSQGFQGEVVEHKNQTTYTGNWSTEYGPDAKHFVDRWPRAPCYPGGRCNPKIT